MLGEPEYKDPNAQAEYRSLDDEIRVLQEEIYVTMRRHYEEMKVLERRLELKRRQLDDFYRRHGHYTDSIRKGLQNE